MLHTYSLINVHFFSFDSFEITYWSKPGPITRQGLKDLIPDKDALFCLLTDKIDQEILQCAAQLKVIGKLN